MSYLLAVDQGTSSTRAFLYTCEGQQVVMSQYPLTQYYPKPGWVEHDPEEIWQKTLTAMRDVVSTIDPQQIKACGLTNQRETTLIWDKVTGRCLAPAIVWQDRRTEAFCASLSASATLIKEKTGLKLDAYFSASKLNWLLTHIPEATQLLAQQRLAFGTIDSFLIWRLTGGSSHVTDVSNASRTLLFNIHEQQWDNDLLQLFAISPEILPKVYASDAHVGTIIKKWLGAMIPITGVAGDQQAALIGQRCVKKGMVKATFGTGGFLMLNTGEKPVVSLHGLLTTIAYRIQGQTTYALEGSFYQAGTTVKWLCDALKLIQEPAETENLARQLNSNEGVYLIPSFTGLGAPHWLSTTGAVIVGLSRTSHRAHFARAALESVCYQTRDILSCMQEDSDSTLSVLKVDGGMTVNPWFLQFLASLCKLQVQRPSQTEATVLGAAWLAGIGCGAIDWLQFTEYQKEEGTSFQAEERALFEAYYQGWQQALQLISV